MAQKQSDPVYILAETIVDSAQQIASSRTEKAHYDKTFNAVILGRNQKFTDNVSEDEQSEIIEKFSIPETVREGENNYYTFKINGAYYCKSQNGDFKLYDKIMVYIPNGNWSDMYFDYADGASHNSGGGGGSDTELPDYIVSPDMPGGDDCNIGDLWIVTNDETITEFANLTEDTFVNMYEYKADENEVVDWRLVKVCISGTSSKVDVINDDYWIKTDENNIFTEIDMWEMSGSTTSFYEIYPNPERETAPNVSIYNYTPLKLGDYWYEIDGDVSKNLEARWIYSFNPETNRNEYKNEYNIQSGSGGVGENLAPYSATSERFNDYDTITFGSTGPTGGSVSTVPYDHLEGYRNYSVGNGSVQDDYVVGNGANHISGQHNKAQSALSCTISGKDNTVSGSSGCDVSGNGNNVSGAQGTVVGGEGNTVTGNHHSVSGNGNEVSGIGDTVGGDSNVVTDVVSSNGYNRVGGRDNIVTNCFTADVIGHGMTVSNSDGATVRGVGDPNDHAAAGLVSGSPFSIAVMNGGKMINCQDSAMFGSGNSMTSSPYSMVFGDVNSLSGGGHNYCIGESNTTTGSIYGFCFGLDNKIGHLHPGTVAMCFGYGAEIGTSDSPPSPYRTGAAFAFGSGNIFTIDYNGDIHAAGSYGTMGADYAEYFEWADGNPNNEDRRGLLVSSNFADCLDEYSEECEKICLANGDDFIGAVSATPAIVGDVRNFDWKNKYKTDIFGAVITDSDNNSIISDDFDGSQQYKSRSSRKEWSPIGLMGKLIVVDNGKCKPGNYIQAQNGVAIPCDHKTKARMMRRVDENHIKVLLI